MQEPTPAPPLILVVENDPAMLSTLGSILEQEGFRVVRAEHGKIALELFVSSPPDLILSAIRMPVLDGFGFLRAMRATREGRRVPFIFLSARSTREDILAGLAAGADAYLTKPLTTEELLSVVRSRLRRFAELKEAFS
jgi:DNA-binding response OmpR family regulator